MSSNELGYLPDSWSFDSEHNMFITGIHSVDDKPSSEMPDTVLTNSSTTEYSAGTTGPAYIYGGRSHNSGIHGTFYFQTVPPQKMPGGHLGGIETVVYSDDYDFLEGERVNVRVQSENIGEVNDRDVLTELNQKIPNSNDVIDKFFKE